jgi:Family of unknown function (DUF6152)
MSANFIARIAVAILACMPAGAHHSIGGTFLNGTVMIEGEVVLVLIRNPHSFLLIDEKDFKTGALVRWFVMWEGAKRLARDHAGASTLKPGDHVIVIGQPTRKPGLRFLYLNYISRQPDGWSWDLNRRTK